MSNLQSILADLKAKQLTQGEIARKNHVSVRTVTRVAKKYELQIGRGIKNYWEFTESSISLTYLIGVYLTDGYITKTYQTGAPSSFALANTSKEYIDYTFQCMESCGLKPKYQATRKGNQLKNSVQDQYVVAAYNSIFANWLLCECHKKNRIPSFVFDAPVTHQLALIAGAIDGDEFVDKSGSIRIRGIDLWLKDLERLLAIINIRTSGLKVERILESGKPYYTVGIKRGDYRKLGGTCIIPEKAQRIAEAKSQKAYDRNKRKRYPCPVCGQVKMWRKNGLFCESCFRKSEQFHQHLKDIAPLGGKAGNEARWNKNP